MYKIELHLHTKYSSICGSMSEQELVAGYKAAGYHGIVVTDHYNRTTFRMKQHDLATCKNPLEVYLEGYYKMREEGERQGIRIYRGAEVCLDESLNDYLLFDYPDALLEEPDAILPLSAAEFAARVHESGALLIQAHPFRDGCTPADPAILDGIEIFNSHPGHNNRNALAREVAQKHPHLIRTGGSDCHDPIHLGRGGILSDTLPQTDRELAALLRSRAFQVIEKIENETGKEHTNGKI